MHLLSFDKVIDYEKEDYTESGIQYDIIVDNKSMHSPFKVIRALKSGGIYICIGGDSKRVTQYALLGRWIFKRHNKRVAVLGLKPNKGLSELTGLVESGKLIPAVDKRYSLEEVPQAIRRFEEAKHCGKIIVLVEPNHRRDGE
jgi:NADPH:quinone reductase-like Zn-dependent oxidoreductase